MAKDLADCARLALACLDLTSLNPTDDEATIDSLCATALGAPGAVAAVCVWPRFVAQARGALPPAVRVAAVANFPHGNLDRDAARFDADAIATGGGNEIDLVLPWRAWADAERRACTALVGAVRKDHPRLTLKLIVEVGELRDAALIASAAAMALDEGVDFLKTSTGTTAQSATLATARLLLETIARHSRRGEVGFKAAGGIRTVSDAAGYISLTRKFLGAVTPRHFRIGASRLLDDIRATLGTAAAQAPAPGTDY